MRNSVTGTEFIQALRPALAGGGGNDVEEGAAVRHGGLCS
jgi:hypothetical protein